MSKRLWICTTYLYRRYDNQNKFISMSFFFQLGSASQMKLRFCGFASHLSSYKQLQRAPDNSHHGKRRNSRRGYCPKESGHISGLFLSAETNISTTCHLQFEIRFPMLTTIVCSTSPQLLHNTILTIPGTISCQLQDWFYNFPPPTTCHVIVPSQLLMSQYHHTSGPLLSDSLNRQGSEVGNILETSPLAGDIN